MRRPFKGRPSRREQIAAFNFADQFYAAAAGVKPKFQQPLPAKRNKITRPVDGKPAVPLESSVNDDIYAVAKELKQGPIWRNNRGVAQYGSQIVTYGVGPKGAADWIGYRRTLITADMVGSIFAQFVAIEAKRPGAATRTDQQAFLDKIIADGGCAGCATSRAEAQEILTAWRGARGTYDRRDAQFRDRPVHRMAKAAIR